MRSLTIQPLTEAHLPAAADLVCTRYTALRRAVPPLPAYSAEPRTLLPRLHDMAQRATGAVALHNGRLVGFLMAYHLERLRGRRGVFSPEWANGVDPAVAASVYAALYAHMAHQWVTAGYDLHGLSLFANDAAANEAWHWLGFGLAVADGVRDLTPLVTPPSPLTIRRATLADLSQLVELDVALHHHLVAAPIFLPLGPSGDHTALADELADPSYAFWTAWAGDEAVAFMKFGPASINTCAVVYDPGTTSITGAFTKVAWRGQGVAVTLLARGLAWADAAGYTRCAVDFEPMNTPAARFWQAHFQLVCLSQLRWIDLC